MHELDQIGTPGAVLLARTALLVATMLGTAAAARAQLDLGSDPSSSWRNLHGTEEVLRESLALDLDRDGRCDLVSLTDGRRVVWSSSPAERQHREILTVGGSAATLDDVALQPDGPGGGAALLTANPNGVHQWSWNAATASLDVVALRADPAGFAQVACARRGTGAYRVAYALHSDGRTVFPILLHAATGGELFPLASFDLGAVAGRIEAFDLDGDGLAELAAVTQSSLTVRRLDGTLAASFPRTSGLAPQADRLAALADLGVAADQLAWTVHEGNVTKLRVITQAGIASDQSLGAEPVLALAARDLDQDGLDDLVLAPDPGPRVRVLRALSSAAPRFATGGANDGEHDTDDPYVDLGEQSDACVAAADFDRDGDVDLALASKVRTAQGTSLTLWRSLDQDHTRLRPTLIGGSVKKGATASTYVVQLELDAPQEAVDADRLRYRVWRQGRLPMRAVGSDPGTASDLPVPATWPFTLELELFADEPYQADWTVEILLADTRWSEDVLHPALFAAASLEDIDAILFHAEPGNDLWGPWGGSGNAAIGSGGVGEIPRIPPAPPSPGPPVPPTPVP